LGLLCRYERFAVPSQGVRDNLKLIEQTRRSHRIATVADVAALGISAARWRRWQDHHEWLQITPEHFRHAATELTFEMTLHAGAQWLGTRGALHAASALFWLGVEVSMPPRAEFVVPRVNRSIPNWIALHTSLSLREDDVIRHRGVRTTTATRALLDYAATGVSANDLEKAIDSAIRLRRTALTRLRKRLSEVGGRGRAGTRLMRELLLDSGGESHLERRFLRLLRQLGLPRPECQVVHRRGNSTVARVDFQLPGTNVVVEVSGRLGHTSDGDRRRDAHRRNALQQSGMQVLEFTTADVIDGRDYVLTTLHTSLLVVL